MSESCERAVIKERVSWRNHDPASPLALHLLEAFLGAHEAPGRKGSCCRLAAGLCSGGTSECQGQSPREVLAGTPGGA